jgi:hypothetical protein
MMQSMIQRSVLSTTASKIRYTAAIRCSTSSIAASSWADTNSKHFRQEVKHRDANPVLLTLTAQQQQSSSFSSSSEKSTKQRMIPRKAALHLTPKAREVFRKLIEATSSEGIKLKYEMSSQNALRMAFKFDLIKDVKKELSFNDEG